MPVSNLGWTFQSQPCFQMYGTKRKNTDKDQQPTTIQEQVVVPFGKRQCLPTIVQEPVNLFKSTNRTEMLLQEGAQNWMLSQLPDSSDRLQQITHTIQACVASNTEGVISRDSKEKHIEMMDSDVTMDDMLTPDSAEDHNKDQWKHSVVQQQIKDQQKEMEQREVLKKRTAKLEEQLKFIQELGVESNDYWATPSDSQLTMQDELEQARIQMECDFAPDPYQYKYISGPGKLPLIGSDVNCRVRCYCKPTWEGVMDQTYFI